MYTYRHMYKYTYLLCILALCCNAGLQYVLPATWTALQKLDPDSDTDTKLQLMARWWSSAPSTTTGLNATKGQIAVGYDADLLVWPCL